MSTRFRKFSFALVSCLLLIAARNGNASCEDITARGTLNVLTINILFSEFRALDQRLTSIAQFVADQFAADPVDIIAVQEAVGGALADELAERLGHTDIETDTADKLRTILSEKFGLHYEFARAFSNGVPGVLAVFNAILSRCSIEFSLAKRLPPAEEVDVRGRHVKLGRSVLMSRIRIPEIGEVNIYNTHLCAGCGQEERFDQAESLIEFAQRMETVFPGVSSIVAGDFNTNIASINDFNKPIYRLIRRSGFVDSYAHSNPDTKLFCSEAQGGPRLGCTFGVSDFGASMRPARIDFIFFKPQGLGVQHSRVVFNPLVAGDAEPSVSDHSAVFTQLRFIQE